LVAEIFKVVDLALAGGISLMAGLTRRIGVFDRGAIVHVLAAAAAAHASPKIIEDVAVEANAFARIEPDHPYANAIALRNQLAADAWIGILLLPFELSHEFRRPCQFIRALGIFVQ